MLVNPTAVPINIAAIPSATAVQQPTDFEDVRIFPPRRTIIQPDSTIVIATTATAPSLTNTASTTPDFEITTPTDPAVPDPHRRSSLGRPGRHLTARQLR